MVQLLAVDEFAGQGPQMLGSSTDPARCSEQGDSLKPESLSANSLMIVWSGLDFKQGSTT